MEITKQLNERTTNIYKEIHAHVLNLHKDSPNKSFEDYIFTALYAKIAELELKLELQDKQIQLLLKK